MTAMLHLHGIHLLPLLLVPVFVLVAIFVLHLLLVLSMLLIRSVLVVTGGFQEANIETKPLQTKVFRQNLKSHLTLTIQWVDFHTRGVDFHTRDVTHARNYVRNSAHLICYATAANPVLPVGIF